MYTASVGSGQSVQKLMTLTTLGGGAFGGLVAAAVSLNRGRRAEVRDSAPSTFTDICLMGRKMKQLMEQHGYSSL